MVFQEGSSNGLKGISIALLRLISFWIEHTHQSLFAFQFYEIEIMSPQAFERRLTAILIADVVGYSRLMRDDEDLTIRTLTGHREMMATLIDHNNGRVVDSPGDNLLAEFFSVTQAVDCAVEIQRELAERNAELPEDRRMEYRIGINLGDVVKEGDRIYGDGVNIAARLESMAEPGGICISGFVYDQVKNRLKLDDKYIGEKRVKNIAEPLLVYRILLAPPVAEHIEPAKEERMAFPLPDKPSIAILPFTNMSGDPSQDYIGDGLSENIISALSISSKIFVIARNSTFSYKGRHIKVQKISEDLGVQYVLEGSIQKSGDLLRVTAQLIDALSGHHLWSEKYDRKMENLFDLQDEITKKIVVELHVELTEGESIRVFAKSTNNLEAWNYYIKGLELFWKFNEEDNAKAREYFKAANNLDPDFVTAFAHQAATHRFDAISGWSNSPSNSFRVADELLQKALKIDEQDTFSHVMLGAIYLDQRQHEKAIAEEVHSIALNPNFGAGYSFLAYTMFYSGRFDEAISLMKKAYRLDPNLPPTWLGILSKVYIHSGLHQEALDICNQLKKRSAKGSIRWFTLLDLSFVFQELGREEEARANMAEALKINPEISREMIRRVNPFKNPAHLQRELDAFRKAGMPEKAPGAVEDKPSIAVLPFVNMSDDPKQEYFSDGMAEELIGALAKLEELKVISRTSAFFFKGKDIDLRTIGEKLKVDNVLEGSVRRAGNKLRISAQLIKVADDTHLWAETYDRELKDVFAIQDEISQAVVQNLKVKLLGTKTEPLVKDYTSNTEAYELFLKAKYFANKGFLSHEKAIEYMEKSIKADPDYVPAYARLAGYSNMMTAFLSLAPWETKPKIDALLQKALEIDDQYADTYMVLGMQNVHEGDWKSAETTFKRALELNPGDPACHFGYSNYLAAVNRINEAMLEAKRAVELDPLSGLYRLILARFLAYDQQFDQAIVVLQELLELDPNDSYALCGLGEVYAENGMYDKGISILQRFRIVPWYAAYLGYCYGKGGMREEAQKILDDFLVREKQGYFSSFLIALVHVGLGDKDKTFEYLDKAYEARDPSQFYLKVLPSFAELHSDPRWTEQLKKRGLAD